MQASQTRSTFNIPEGRFSVAVIIVNYGTADLAIAAVESVLDRQHGGRAVSIHLVDNASPGGDAARLADAHAARGWDDRVALYLEQENHGFGRGNNVVLRALMGQESPPDAVMLLNPDARLENEALDLMASRLEQDPTLGLAGPGIALPDGSPRVAAFRFPSLISEFANALAVGPVFKLLRRWQMSLPAAHPEGAVDWVAGAAPMLRTKMLAEIGLFDPDFFLYYEEVELMWRAARAGWRCLYVPEAKVVHVEGAATDVKSSRAAKRRPGYWYDSWRLYHLKTRGRAGALVVALAVLLGAALNWGLAALRRKPRAAAPHFFSDFPRHVLSALAGRA